MKVPFCHGLHAKTKNPVPDFVQAPSNPSFSQTFVSSKLFTLKIDTQNNLDATNSYI